MLQVSLGENSNELSTTAEGSVSKSIENLQNSVFLEYVTTQGRIRWHKPILIDRHSTNKYMLTNRKVDIKLKTKLPQAH